MRIAGARNSRRPDQRPGDALAAAPRVSGRVDDAAPGARGLSSRSCAAGLGSCWRPTCSRRWRGRSPRRCAARTFESAALARRSSTRSRGCRSAKADLTIGGRLPRSRATSTPVYRSPVITTPLRASSAAFAPDAILADASRIPPDTVALFEENRTFIEAFLVGANHEMNKELRWREFPTDMRGTIFRRFWDRGRPAGRSGRRRHRRAIHTWTSKLGRAFRAGRHRQGGEPGDRHPQRRSCASSACRSWSSTKPRRHRRGRRDKGINHEPVFFGNVGRDIAYYGFDVARDHIVEHRARPRVPGDLRAGRPPALRPRRGDRGRAPAAARHRHAVAARSRCGRSAATEQRVLRATAPAAAGSARAPTSWDDFSWPHMTSVRPPATWISSRVITVAGQPDYWGARQDGGERRALVLAEATRRRAPAADGCSDGQSGKDRKKRPGTKRPARPRRRATRPRALRRAASSRTSSRRRSNLGRTARAARCRARRRAAIRATSRRRPRIVNRPNDRAASEARVDRPCHRRRRAGRSRRPRLRDADRTPPLLLLPLRLEYRFVTSQRRPRSSTWRAAPGVRASTSGTRPGAADRQHAWRTTQLASATLKRAPRRPAGTLLAGRREIWFRWYPDESFATQRHGAAERDRSRRRSAAFRRALGGRPWHSIWPTPETVAAWQDSRPGRAVPGRSSGRAQSAQPTDATKATIGAHLALPKASRCSR